MVLVLELWDYSSCFLMGGTGYGKKLAVVGMAMLSKSLIQLSANGLGYASSLFVVWPGATKSLSLQMLW